MRRLLENGANTSFVSVAADPDVPVATILRRPRDMIQTPAARNRKIPLPRDLYGVERMNSSGVEFGDRASLDALLEGVRTALPKPIDAAPLIDGVAQKGAARDGRLRSTDRWSAA